MLYVPSGDIAAFADAVETLIDDPGAARRARPEGPRAGGHAPRLAPAGGGVRRRCSTSCPDSRSPGRPFPRSATTGRRHRPAGSPLRRPRRRRGVRPLPHGAQRQPSGAHDDRVRTSFHHLLSQAAAATPDAPALTYRNADRQLRRHSGGRAQAAAAQLLGARRPARRPRGDLPREAHRDRGGDLRRLRRRRRLRADQPRAQGAAGRPHPGRQRCTRAHHLGRPARPARSRCCRTRGRARRSSSAMPRPIAAGIGGCTAGPTAQDGGAGPRPLAAIDIDPAAILYTSGSTGKPKGVVLSHRNLIVGAESVSTYLENTARRRHPERPAAELRRRAQPGDDGLRGRRALRADELPAAAGCAASCASSTASPASPACRRSGCSWPTCSWPEAAAGACGTGPTRVDGCRARRSIACGRSSPQADPYLMYGLTEAFRSTYLDPAEVDRRPGLDRQGDPERRDPRAPAGRHAVRARRGRRTRAPRRARRARLLERPDAHRGTLSARARARTAVARARDGRLVGRHGGGRRGGLPVLRRPHATT